MAITVHHAVDQMAVADTACVLTAEDAHIIVAGISKLRVLYVEAVYRSPVEAEETVVIMSGVSRQIFHRVVVAVEIAEER